jgi:hypothetical protein
MSDERSERSGAERSSTPEPSPGEATPPRTSPPETSPDNETSPDQKARFLTAGRAQSRTTLWLGALLILTIAGVLLSPFWATAVMPLLPWGRPSASEKYDAIADRVAALEQRPNAPPLDVDAIKSAQAALAQRIAAAEEAVAALRRADETAATKAALAQQAQRLDAIAAQSTVRAAAQTAEIEKVQQELAQRGVAGGALAHRLDALEHRVQAQNVVARSSAVQLLALLQLREAVDAAHPFAAEYAAFQELVAHDPELAAAARPLAEAAPRGVASPVALRQRLSDLADQITTVKAPAAKHKWWAEALDRLSALVTIRHLGGSTKSGHEGAIDTAQADLAQDDLAGAVAAMDELTGANAEAAQPWLRMARQRLAAQTALTRLQELLTARLGARPVSPPAAAAPSSAPAPAVAPALPKTPS